MRPPMPDEVVIDTPKLDDNGDEIKDDYGRKKTKEIESAARVQRKSNLKLDKDGQEIKTNIEIDLPKDIKVIDGSKIKGKAQDEVDFEGIIISTEDIINLTGSKVHYRTVFVNGRE